MNRFRLSLLALLIFPPLHAQEPAPLPITSQAVIFRPDAPDPIDRGLYWLYQLQYDKSYQAFDEQCTAHPDDPAGYFGKAAIDWWHLAQQFDFSLPKIQERFYRNVDITIQKSKAAAESARGNPKALALAYLYRGGAEGLRGRWLVTQKQWVKAYFAGRNGHHFLELALKNDPELYDAYMGLGIYDYFTDTLGGVQKVLAALLVRGDRERGMQELRMAIEKGHRARVESMIFLMEIYTSEEKTPDKALPLTRQLRQEFPQSPAMHLAEIMALYAKNDWEAVVPEALEFLDKSRREQPWYTKEGVRPALYVLGVAELWGRHNPSACLFYMNQILEGGIDTSRWVTFAYLRRGQIEDSRGERQKAIEDYRRVLSREDFWGAHHEARTNLETPFKA